MSISFDSTGCITYDKTNPIRVDAITNAKHFLMEGVWYLLPSCIPGVENGDLNKIPGVSLGAAINSKKATKEVHLARNART